MNIKSLYSVDVNRYKPNFIFTNKRKAIRFGIAEAKKNNEYIYISVKNSANKQYKEFIRIDPKGDIQFAYSGGGYLDVSHYFFLYNKKFVY
jgi:hypothetical protein